MDEPTKLTEILNTKLAGRYTVSIKYGERALIDCMAKVIELMLVK